MGVEEKISRRDATFTGVLPDKSCSNCGYYDCALGACYFNLAMDGYLSIGEGEEVYTVCDVWAEEAH